MDPGASFATVVALLVVAGMGFFMLLKKRDERTARRQLEARMKPIPLPQHKMPRLKFSAFNLQPGAVYRVVKEFRDYDGTTHAVGERWTYLSHSFLPYDDGLSLFIEKDGRQLQVRLQCREEEQGGIADAFSDYMAEESNWGR